MVKNKNLLSAFFILFFAFIFASTPTKAHAAAHTVSTFAQLESALADGDNAIDITITASFDITSTITIPAGKSVSITSDASGPFTLTRGAGATGNLFTVSAGANLTLSKIILDGNYIHANNPLVYITAGGELEINEGTVLQYNSSSFMYGGAVTNSGTMTMTGGSISNNGSTGVHNAEGATFRMSGGTISDQTPGVSGVYNAEGATFQMSGGTISGNSASYGGGVYNEMGTFEMSGGTISGNSAFNSGGGVFSYGGKILLAGGVISGNSSVHNGGGVYIYEGGTLFQMTSGEITGNDSEFNGGGVYINNGTFEMSGGTISGNEVRFGPGGGVSYSAYNEDYFFKMSGGTISDNTASNGGGVSLSSGTFEMSNGTISGNQANDGGGISIAGSFILLDGEISDNTANRGGGISLALGTFEMSGGKISDNTASANGGGIYHGSGVTLHITGGVISSNTAAVDGGGLYTENYANIELPIGGSVAFSGNTAGSLHTPPAVAPVPASQWVGTISSISPSFPGNKNITVFNNYDINFDSEPLNGPYPIIYHANNGSGDQVNAGTKFPYEAFTVAGNTFTTSGKRFVGWNTKADGSGTTYLPGDEAVMPNEDAPFTFNLYAMWEPVPETPETPATAPPPKTGDTNALSLYGMLLCAAIGLAVCASVFAKKKRAK